MSGQQEVTHSTRLFKEDLSNVSSVLIHRRRYQSSQSHQRRFGGENAPLMNVQILHKTFVRYRTNSILVTKHNLEDEISFSVVRELKRPAAWVWPESTDCDPTS